MIKKGKQLILDPSGYVVYRYNHGWERPIRWYEARLIICWILHINYYGE